jgi:hypothetical protein
MNLGENRIEMQIPWSAWFPRDLCFPHSQADIHANLHDAGGQISRLLNQDETQQLEVMRV